ncbi:MAG: DMT family transporter [Candidatus Dormibacteria bacterium]
MSLTLALSAAVLWGVGDFCGGLATRRSPLLTVLLFSHLLGLVGMIAASLLLGGSVTAGDLLLGAIGGIAGALGVAMLYRSLSVGLMTLIAPVTGVIAAGLPVIVGILILPERLSITTVTGILVALAAVGLLGGAPASVAARIDPVHLALAVGAGIGFAGFYIALSRTSGDAGLWPLVAARCASVTMFGLATVAGRHVPRTNRPGGALILAAGLFDVTANALYVVAVHGGVLSIVAVLVSLYPGATIACALILLRERLQATQIAGVAAALVAVVLISLR